ncbi:MAG: DUF1549 domain-containing protein [Planctomycetes bacterium]|nr:DUF1549 domain-containing protein [Planctomycetota bacterium]
MKRFRRLCLSALLASISCALIVPVLTSDSAAAQKRKKRRKAKRKRTAGKQKPAAVKLPPLRTPADRLKFLEVIRQSMPTRKIGRNVRFSSADLDRNLEISIGTAKENYAPLISDEAFVRRVHLDLIGRIPTPAGIKAFVAGADAKKREKLIDRLLDTKAYARKWAKYWRDVIFHDSTANRRRVNAKALEDWFAREFERNSPWDRITAALVSAMPVRNRKKKNDYGQNIGPNNFVLAFQNKPKELAGQTARIFMGISIQCAECHDHPFDRWKREQFHELAAFFARGKYTMPGMDDPAKKTVMQPRFLLGEKPPANLKAAARRVAVAAYLIYNPGNYWFARAYVNRIWNELIGDGFYSVDSLGPDGEVVHKLIINRLAALFRYRNFDPKWVFRIIMNSRAYQRDIRSIRSDDKLFTAVRPSRMRPDQVVASLQKITGANRNIARSLSRAFRVNPSIPQRDLEGSIQQALLLMNNRAIQARLRNSPLKRRLLGIKQNEAMIDELYLSILARKPTYAENTRSLTYIKSVGNRTEAVEDLMWVLVNSTEFITKR